MVRPIRVSSSPRSVRIGSRVPSAVEVTAIAVATSALIVITVANPKVTAKASPRQHSQVSECPSTTGADQLTLIQLVPGEQKQQAEAEFLQHVDLGCDLSDVEAERSDDDVRPRAAARLPGRAAGVPPPRGVERSPQRARSRTATRQPRQSPRAATRVVAVGHDSSASRSETTIDQQARCARGVRAPAGRLPGRPPVHVSYTPRRGRAVRRCRSGDPSGIGQCGIPPTAESAETIQNEQITKLPSFPDRLSTLRRTVTQHRAVLGGVARDRPSEGAQPFVVGQMSSRRRLQGEEG